MNNPVPLFQQYTPYDTEIVKTATRYGLYLIGGTAIDLLCRYYSVPFGETDLIMTLIFGLRLPIRKGTGSSNR